MVGVDMAGGVEALEGGARAAGLQAPLAASGEDVGTGRIDGLQSQAPLDPGLVCLVMAARHYRISADPRQLTHELGLAGAAASATDIVRSARHIGLKARATRLAGVGRLASVPLPAILKLDDGRFALLARRLPSGAYVLAYNPSRTPDSAENLHEAALAARWSGEIILLTRRVGGPGVEPSRFGLTWFLPSIWRYRRALAHVVVASLFIQLFALVTPLFFQVVIDKVLVHGASTTLSVLVIGLVLLGFFDVVLQQLRSYVLTHTTSRMDVELGARLFDHLMRLPQGYFESRPSGQTLARMRELEAIRGFLTGQGLTSVLDVLFTTVFLAVMWLYAPTLTLVVMASIPLYLLIAALVRPALRQAMAEKFQRAAASQQFLVETIVGINTLKSAAVEPVLRAQWEDRLAASVRTSLGAALLGTAGQNAIQFVHKVTMAIVLYLGATAVIAGELSVGGLVAFNMLAAQATQPILRLSQLWQDLQQAQISVERLGDILNVPQENQRLSGLVLPVVRGAIAMKDVTFRYEPGGRAILDGISLDIAPGETIGIVGPSGSGKSTLTRLFQRLYRPERGQVLIDGIDIAGLDLASLRRQTGVVLQDNLLFNMTIHENIALANPGLPRRQVMAAARLAGAASFIERLPQGYDTVIEERGANLSGGQRQRIAIARALAMAPRILILDEATSALDTESEEAIEANMAEITRGRTVIIISHRLAAVRGCDRIIALDEGRIIEAGSHAELIARPGGYYARLWQRQFGGTAP